jgi:catechol 2,3-dioxygenase-like lactoylglutathione lyase family enzyme
VTYGFGVEQRISLITLGVADVSLATRFYQALGWRGQELEGTVFFQAGPIVVVLWGRDQLAADAGLTAPAARSAPVTADFAGIALAHNVRSREEVDAVMAAAADAGATVTQPARETFYGGHAGYFADPDGHLWEVAYNPGFRLDGDGAIALPEDLGTPT